MELRLAIPPLSPAANTESFQPEEVERLLESARHEHKPDAARKLLDLITAMNRVRLDPEVREATLELIVPEARQLCARLRQPWREGREAAGEAARQGLRLSLDLVNEVGYGYKHLLMASSARRFGLWGGKPEAALVRVTLHALGNIFMFSYEAYRPTPAGLWHEVHQLYRYGREHGLLKEANERGQTVETEYKRCLLLAAIDPYHLERGDLIWLLPYLNSHAEEIRLTEPSSGAGDEPGQFRLLLDSDKPPMPLTEAIQSDKPGLELMLDTRALPTLIQKDLTRLEMGEAPSRLGLPPDAPAAKYLSALARIAATWEGKRQRKFSRRTAQDMQVAVLAGLRSLYEGMAQTGDAARASVCTPVNDSPSGIALQLKSGDMQISVGELIAMRSGVQPDWNVGVVRWVKGGGTGQTQFGVQWLAPGAVPVSLSLPQERKGHPVYPALLLRNSGSDESVDMMIAQPGLYREQRHYQIEYGQERQTVKAGRALEQTGCFDLFEIEMRESG
jgi:cyclic-di-GMP-binding protein